MTDIEICNRIAEIDGVQGYFLTGILFTIEDDNPAKCFNPLHDDALCFQLMIKHDVSVQRDGDNKYWVAGKGVSDDLYDSPNKAICLAIINSHQLTQ